MWRYVSLHMYICTCLGFRVLGVWGVSGVWGLGFRGLAEDENGVSGSQQLATMVLDRFPKPRFPSSPSVVRVPFFHTIWCHLLGRAPKVWEQVQLLFGVNKGIPKRKRALLGNLGIGSLSCIALKGFRYLNL